MKIIFHNHTIYSDDGHIGLETLRRRLDELGVQAVCITDHNSIEGAMRFRDRYPELITVVGEEIMTREGEVIGLFLTESILPGQSLHDTVTAIRAQGGLIALPHPCDVRRPSTLRAEALAEALAEADIVEVFNGRTFDRDCDRRAEVLCREHGCLLIWGSDAHSLEELGHVPIDMDPFHDAPSFLEALRGARPLQRIRTTLPLRMIVRLRRFWGFYGPLRLPERMLTWGQRVFFRAVGGGFVTLQEIDVWCGALADRVRESGFRPEVVVGIAGGGLYPAFRLASILGVPYDSLRVSYPQLRIGRLDTDDLMGAIVLRNRLLGNEPRLLRGPREDLKGKRVLLVDDDCTTGRSLQLGLGAVREAAAEIKTLTLRVLAEADPRPDFSQDDRTGAVFRHPRFPWIKYSPEYRRYALFRERWL